MAKNKISNTELLKLDLEKITIPFDLFTGLSLVIEELKKKGFSYRHFTQEGSVMMTFESKKIKENIYINIEKENLLIRQFSMNGDTRKLKVIYVVKPSERAFKLV